MYKARVSFAVPRQSSSPTQEAGKPTEGLFTRKANAAKKRKLLDPMVGSPPLYVDFTASMCGEDVSLVDKPIDVAMISTEGSAPLTIAVVK